MKTFNRKQVLGTMFLMVLISFATFACKAAGAGGNGAAGPVTGGGKVETPAATPAGGDYDGSQSVELSSKTDGAEIWYTLDGSNPGKDSGTLYAASIEVAMGTTLTAIAVKSGMTDSDVLTAIYTQFGAVVMPQASPPGGNYAGPQSVGLSSGTFGASIYYTLNGSAPTKSSTLYNDTPISVDMGTTLKAFAVLDGMTDSAIMTAVYARQGTVATPVASPPGESYGETQSVTLSSTMGAAIYYTTDSNDPTRESTLYNNAISVPMGTTLKAFAVKDGLTDSAIMTEIYTQQGTVVAPQANPPAGYYAGTQNVQLSSDTTDAEIFYSLGGGNPTTPYTGSAITVNLPNTLKAVAKKTGMTDSALLIAEYLQMQKAATPEATPPAGEYTGPQNVTLSIVPADASITIYYTLGSGSPDIQYVSPFAVTMGQTLKAVAKKTGMIDSDVLSATYTAAGIVAAPVATPGAGPILSNQTITLSTTPSDATIRYTIDGADPTASSGEVYTTPILASAVIGKTLRAIAYKAAMTDSAVTSADYTHLKAATPTATEADIPASITSKSVTLSSTNGGDIHYTLDGTPPSALSASYSSAITIDATTTLKAIAIVTDYADSDVLTRTYTIKVAAPTSTTASGTYTSVQSVLLETTTPGAIIRYTDNGDEPTETDTPYAVQIDVSSSKTIKAKAFKADLLASDTLTLDYTINMVTAIDVTPDPVSVIRGTSQAFTATPVYTGSPATTVTWDVNSLISSIDTSTGILTVPVAETASTLTVTATSTANPGTSGTATVTVTDLYSQTGSGTYEWTVPVAGDYEIELTGASGGNGYGAGGKGGIITGTISLMAGITYEIKVGGAGGGYSGTIAGTGGFNGGGSGGNGYGTWAGGGGGGGASDIRTVNGDYTTRMMVAGGGGGGAKAVGNAGVNGGNAGNGNGGSGAAGSNGSAGATTTSGNANGVGGNGTAGNSSGSEGGAGGGGGYYGANATGRGIAGGGGSSWANSSFTNVTPAADGAGTNSGNGKVRINKLP